MESRPNAWADWFAEKGGTPSGAGGMLMDLFSMMIQVAIPGLGVALLPDYLARIEIDARRLEPVLEPAVPFRGTYGMVWPEGRQTSAPLAAFRAWLAGQTAFDGLDHS